MNTPHFIYIADVYCPWCYAFAPIMQKVTRNYPEFPVKVVGGNLISRPLGLIEDAEQSPGLVEFWQEVEKSSGRSLQGAIDAVLQGKNVRMYSPGADEILAVLKKLAPGHELEQLIELEEMFYGKGEDIFTGASLAQLAQSWNIPAANFESALDQPVTLAATEKNLELASRLMGEITSYPSVLLSRGDKIDAVTRGFVQYETVISRLEDALQDLGLEEMAAEACSWHHDCTTGKSRKK